VKIEDGKGSGRLAEVDSSQRIKTFSVTEPESTQINREGKVWSLLQSTTAVGVGDYVFYLKNTGTVDLAVEDFEVFVGAATTLYLDAVSGTPTFAAGVDITPIQRNLGSSKIPDATIKEDTNTTGLTNDGTIVLQRCAAANTHYYQRVESDIIIPAGQAVALRTSVATAVETLFTLVDLS
jgi:hypothetical protein